jgi:biopolymer transport protein ExbD
MRFSRRHLEEPEINLIPFIDVLLVVLIFLMLSTSYARFTELQITLPTADADKLKDRPGQVVVGVNAEGNYSIDQKPIEGRSVETLAAALTAASAGHPETVVIISADAMSAHQSVINVLDAARRAGLSRLTFAAQTTGAAGAR